MELVRVLVIVRVAIFVYPTTGTVNSYLLTSNQGRSVRDQARPEAPRSMLWRLRILFEDGASVCMRL